MTKKAFELEAFNNLSPCLDENRYPEEDTLDDIQCYPYWGGYGKLMSCITHLFEGMPGTWQSSLHKSDDEARATDYFIYRFTTGGWSGCEDVIRAMQENTMFWAMCWYQSTRGGEHIFHINPALLKYNEEKHMTMLPYSELINGMSKMR